MLKFWIICLIVSLKTLHSSEAPLLKRDQYSQQLYNAFLIQSIGETRLAYRIFKHAYQEAQRAREKQLKLDAINSMFVWYRKYGWGLGLMTKAPNCSGQSGRALSLGTTDYPNSNYTNQDYVSEWGKNPQQAKHIRSFVFGVAEITAGIFAVSIGTPLGYTIAGASIYSGISRCFDSFNEVLAQHEESTLALKAVQGKIIEASKQPD